MLAPSPIVKKTAKTALSGHWLQAFAVSCVLLFTFFICELASSLVSVFAGTVGYIAAMIFFTVFAISPLGLGVLCYFRRRLWEQEDSLLIIFKYFSSVCEYKRSLRFLLLLGFKTLVVAAALFSPCLIVWLLSNEKLYSWLDMSLPIWASNLWTLNSFIALVATFALVFIMLKYYLSPFIFVSNDDVDPAEALNMSGIISKRTGADFFWLILSFSGWLLLSVFVAPLIFTLPYFVASYCVHCRFAITAYNSDVDRFNADITPHYSTDEI